YQVAQGLPDDGHDAELGIVQVAGHRQLDIDVAPGVLEQGQGQAYRQVHRVRAVDPFAELQVLEQDSVVGLQLALIDAVVQVQIQPSLADAVAGELAGVGRQRSEEHTSELQSRENLVCRLLLEKKK